jgi:predicted porin
MKLKVLSLAVIAAAVPATGLMAEATLYGQIDAGLTYTDFGTTDQFDVRSNDSRIGFKGEEDLGGIYGIYQAEYGIDVADDDTNSGIFKTRDSFVGLRGDFGTVFVGTFDTPYKKSQGKIDHFNDRPGDMANFLGGEERVDSQIGYKTPDMGGLKAFVSFAPGESEGTDNLGAVQDGVADSISFNVTYEMDGIYLAAGYDMNQNWGFWEGTPYNNTPVATTPENHTDALRLVGSITMDTMGFGALFQTAEQSDVPNPAEQTGYLFSGYTMIDQTKFFAQYGSSSHEQTGVVDVDISSLGIGAEQFVSERTSLYTGYTMRSLEVASAPSVDTDIFMVGAKHKF